MKAYATGAGGGKKRPTDEPTSGKKKK